jgi:hypothetical protein
MENPHPAYHCAMGLAQPTQPAGGAGLTARKVHAIRGRTHILHQKELTATMENLVQKTIQCTDISHGHRTETINMISFDHNGHHFEITQDGEFYDAFIDDETLAVLNLTAAQLDAYLAPYMTRQITP